MIVDGKEYRTVEIRPCGEIGFSDFVLFAQDFGKSVCNKPDESALQGSEEGQNSGRC